MRALSWHCERCHYVKQSSSPMPGGECPCCRGKLTAGAIPAGQYVPMYADDERREYDRMMREPPRR